MGEKSAPYILALLVASITVIAAYSNHFHNSFHFDDAHTIVNNNAIRELRNIPQFFRDGTSFSSLPSNQSYRPLVSTLLAINYALAGGLHPFWFHLSIFALFFAVVLVLGYVLHQLLERFSPRPANRWFALGGACWYGLHPANADTVNYIIACSEVISTLGVVASFAAYFAFPRQRRYFLYVVPAAIATLAKPTAAMFPVLFAVYWLLFEQNRTHLTETRLQRIGEIILPLVICGAMLWFVQHMTPVGWVAGATNTHDYFITQPYVTLLYFKTFFWPAGLSADYDLNPFSAIYDARFWVGIVFVALLVAAAIAAAKYKRTRMIGFGLLWFLIALLPTALFPLAEVMNDHRTFLPYIGLVIAMAGVARMVLPLRANYSLLAKIAATGVVAVLLSATGYATYQRNKVWKDEESLWHDVVLKSPRNGRGLMNYGLTLMAKGDYAGALDYFHRAEPLTPHYSLLLINLAIAENATKEPSKAEQHFKDALRLAPSSPDSYTYYARYLLSHSRVEEARGFLQSALELSPADLNARDLLARADAQTPNPPAPQTPEYYLDLSLKFYGEERYAESIVASRRALDLRPAYAEAWNNICAADNKLGRYDEAVAACEQALRFKPDLELARNNLQYARQMAKPSGK
jgi:Flp pilus assembly protein TadD